MGQLHPRPPCMHTAAIVLGRVVPLQRHRRRAPLVCGGRDGLRIPARGQLRVPPPFRRRRRVRRVDLRPGTRLPGRATATRFGLHRRVFWAAPTRAARTRRTVRTWARGPRCGRCKSMSVSDVCSETLVKSAFACLGLPARGPCATGFWNSGKPALVRSQPTRALCSARSRNTRSSSGRSAANARALWLTRFFSSSGSSAIVCSVPSTTNSGS